MIDKKYHGFLLFMVCLVIFTLSDSVAKYLSNHFAVPLLVWARYVIHFVLMLFLVVPKKGREIFVTQHPWLMLLRGLGQLGSTYFILLAFQVLPLAETTAIVFVSPLLVALLAGPVLGEKVRLRSWLATVIGFSGVLLIVRPGGEMTGVGVLYALGSALCYSTYQLLTRKMSASEPQFRQLFYVAMIGAVFSSMVVPFFWSNEIPSFIHGSMIFSLGIFGWVGHFLMIRAFHETPASRLSPLLYSQLIWSTLCGFLFFGHIPDFYGFLGMIVICCSGLILTLHRPHFVDRLLKKASPDQAP